MSALVGTVAVMLAKLLAATGIVLFFATRLSAIGRALSQWTRVHVLRPRRGARCPRRWLGNKTQADCRLYHQAAK